MNDHEHFTKREQLIKVYYQIKALIVEYGHWGIPDHHQDTMMGMTNGMNTLLWNAGLVPAKESNIELARYVEQLGHIQNETRGLRNYGKDIRN